jgi:N utilization substance protein A
LTDFEIGEDVSEEVKLIDLGRRAILALRQNLISKIMNMIIQIYTSNS